MDSGFSPLDDDLGLLPGEVLTPLMRERLVRLGAWVSFERSIGEFIWYFGTHITESTARRITESTGAIYAAVQDKQAKQLVRALEDDNQEEAADKLLLSVDGAMVHAVGGEWTEVKTMTIGCIEAPTEHNGKPQIRTDQHSYFSRRSEAHDFIHQALVETQRRGIERSKTVCAVTDGAEWIQTFVDAHCPDAVRILDFYHAAEHLAAVGRIVYGSETPEFQAWFAQQRHELRHGNPDLILAELRQLAQRMSTVDMCSEIEKTVRYFESRRAMINYAHFVEQGYPIGSGAGEACHKVVIEQRMKQSGMRWAIRNINPMAALRNMVCNDRWDEGMHQVLQYHRQQRLNKHADKIANRIPPDPLPDTSATHASRLPPHFKLRPAIPWRNQPVGKARYNSVLIDPGAKT